MNSGGAVRYEREPAVLMPVIMSACHAHLGHAHCKLEERAACATRLHTQYTANLESNTQKSINSQMQAQPSLETEKEEYIQYY